MKFAGLVAKCTDFRVRIFDGTTLGIVSGTAGEILKRADVGLKMKDREQEIECRDST